MPLVVVACSNSWCLASQLLWFNSQSLKPNIPSEFAFAVPLCCSTPHALAFASVVFFELSFLLLRLQYKTW
ncbi:hypothetical protein V2J09_006013 [Rumex salicifolius]